ncbi:MAG: dihydroxyacetone kinase subunit DhaL [Candidatus Dormiibacterota bacterium]
MDSQTVTAWMNEIAASVRAERDYLVQLDAAIGDGDHGINLNRGFDAVTLALSTEPDGTPGKLLILSGKTLISTVGGASGPLWGSALRKAGRALGDETTFDLAQLVDAMAAALASIQDLGAAVPGDKTMVDALEPAVTAMRVGLARGASSGEMLRSAAEAAEAGMRATIPMQARKGRASYLGERSIGHQDPGATSTAMIIRALERTVAGTP